MLHILHIIRIISFYSVSLILHIHMYLFKIKLKRVFEKIENKIIIKPRVVAIELLEIMSSPGSVKTDIISFLSF